MTLNPSRFQSIAPLVFLLAACGADKDNRADADVGDTAVDGGDVALIDTREDTDAGDTTPGDTATDTELDTADAGDTLTDIDDIGDGGDTSDVDVASDADTGDTTPDPGTWSIVTSGLTRALLGVGGSADNDVWAVGPADATGAVALHWDGTDWDRVDTGTRVDLWWVHGLPDGQAVFGGSESAVLVWDGDSFTRLLPPGLARNTVFGVWASSTDDIWAVGSRSSRNGFIWHYDGEMWTEWLVPRDVPRDANGDAPGLFKVWSDGTDVWVVGDAGTVLRGNADEGFAAVESSTPDRLLTIHGADGNVVAVGGNTGARTLAVDATGCTDVTPPGTPLLQGVFVTGAAHAYACGQGGVFVEDTGAGWERLETGLTIPVQSLHALWVSPTGQIWAVGGNVLGPTLDQGIIVHRGSGISAYVPPAPPTPADPVCPTAAIDPVPTESIARRWNEQMLNAIRRDIPRPTVHARNLYHVSAAMYDAWAAYDSVADGVFYSNREAAADVVAAREEAISYAAYRVLKHRYSPTQTGGPVSQVCFDEFMAVLGYDASITTVDGDSPAAVGNRVAAAIIAFGATDGANEAANYADTTGWAASNPVLSVEGATVPMTNATLWQQINLARTVTQNGIETTGGVQGYIGAHWREVTPFAIRRPAAGEPYFNPPAPVFEPATIDQTVEVIRRSAELAGADDATIDLSPGAFGNNPLATNDGAGHPTNPATGEPYAANVVPVADFGRVLAEFWADGPRSETPPGHWNTIANQVSDHPDFEPVWLGDGELLDPLEWDVKIYLTLNGAVHDAAIAAWEQKRNTTTARPLSLVRYRALLGQSSDDSLPSYHADGLPLIPGLIELITAESTAPGERHEHLFGAEGRIAIYAWRGEPYIRGTQIGGAGWILGRDWMPYQLRTFVTPAFPGFVSGHSTFSRSAAEVLAALTGTAYFPGGLGEFVARQNEYLSFEEGPSVEVRLQWGTYYDAADQAGQSRIWGGIHVYPDDFGGRTIGYDCGIAAVDLALSYFDGTAVAD